jgi:hypothetical protein
MGTHEGLRARMAGRPYDNPTERAALLAHLGVSRIIPTLSYYASEKVLPHITGYRVEVLSVPTDELPIAAGDPWSAPDDHGEPHSVVRWRVYRPGTRGFLEVRWTRDREHREHWRLDDFEPENLDEFLPLVKRSLVTFSRGGRPKGSGKEYPTPASYRAAIRSQIYDRPDRAARVRTAPPWQIARWLHLGKSTMYDRNREYGVHMDDIRERRI